MKLTAWAGIQNMQELRNVGISFSLPKAQITENSSFIYENHKININHNIVFQEMGQLKKGIYWLIER